MTDRKAKETSLVRLLEWVGSRARWFLTLGAISALFFQDLAAFLRPALPAFVALMYFLAMLRVDLIAVIRGVFRLKRMLLIAGVCVLLMAGTPALMLVLAGLAGLSAEFTTSLVYISAAPPLGSAAALCLLLGLNAALALEITIVGSFLAPFLGPLVTAALLGDAVPLDPAAMSLRLAGMIGTGAILALIFRPVIGAKVITCKAALFDGIGAIAMVATVLPIFAGATGYIIQAPLTAAFVLVLVFALNIGAQVLSTPVLRRLVPGDSAGTVGLIWGNRNAALFMAALPPSPVFALFVALYQFPMYMTPLLLKGFFRPEKDR